MSQTLLPRWIVQSAAGIALVVGFGFAAGLSFALGAAPARAPQAQAPGVSATGGCEPGFSGSPDTKCEDVNECAISNGGCHRLTGCENTPGSRVCGGCPKDYRGDGYVGCLDVNECAEPDCSDRLPKGTSDAPAPAVTTSGDVTVTGTSAKGAAATFTATAKDSVDGTRPVNCMPVSGSMFRVGKTTVTCWAFNKRGKIGRTTLTVTVN